MHTVQHVDLHFILHPLCLFAQLLVYLRSSREEFYIFSIQCNSLIDMLQCFVVLIDLAVARCQYEVVVGGRVIACQFDGF